MHCQGSDNISVSVEIGLLRRFLGGQLPWTGGWNYPSATACIDWAKRQARELAEAGDPVAQYQLGRYDGHLYKNPAAENRLVPATGGQVKCETSC